MRRWDFEIGGLVFAVGLLVAVVMVAASIIGHILQAIGML